MANTQNFLYGPSGNEPDPDVARVLRRYCKQLESMRDMVLYEMDHRKITQNNIDMLTRDLSEIIGSIDKMMRNPDIVFFFPTLGEIESHVRLARKCLHMASRLLGQSPTQRTLNALFEEFEKFPDILLDAINLFTS